MPLTEAREFAGATINEFGHISVRTDIVIYRDGAEISRVATRRVIPPGADVSDEPDMVQDIAAAVWTTERLAEYDALKAKLTAQQALPAKGV